MPRKLCRPPLHEQIEKLGLRLPRKERKRNVGKEKRFRSVPTICLAGGEELGLRKREN